MLDATAVTKLQAFMVEQAERKARLGKPDYAVRKLWEEMAELNAEIMISSSDKALSENFVSELGDLLFCVLGNKTLARELQERLDYDMTRAERCRLLDLETLA